MPRSITFMLVVFSLCAALIAACQPAMQNPIPATELPTSLPVTQPGYPPPAAPTQAQVSTPTNKPTTPADAPAAVEPVNPYPAPNDLGPKATPVSDSPAAGVCDLQEGELVTFEINEDIPSPRCAQALPGQRLKVINRTDYDLDVSIASFKATLAPGEETVFDAPLGGYLLPGVHVVMTSAYGGGGGPELWLVDAAPTEAPYPAP